MAAAAAPSWPSATRHGNGTGLALEINLPERVQGALGLTVGEVGIAKATEAGAVFPGQAHVARPGDRHLGELDSGPGVAGRQREVGADHQEQRIPTTGGGARRVRGGSEVDVRLIDPARRAFDHDEHDVGERDGLRLVEGRGEFEGVGSPRSGARQVAPVELDHAEQDPHCRADERRRAVLPAEHHVGSIGGAVEGARHPVDPDLGGLAERIQSWVWSLGVDLRGGGELTAGCRDVAAFQVDPRQDLASPPFEHPVGARSRLFGRLLAEAKSPIGVSPVHLDDRRDTSCCGSGLGRSRPTAKQRSDARDTFGLMGLAEPQKLEVKRQPESGFDPVLGAHRPIEGDAEVAELAARPGADGRAGARRRSGREPRRGRRSGDAAADRRALPAASSSSRAYCRTGSRSR